MYEGIEQGTDEWKSIKRGKIGASRIFEVMMDKKTAGYRNYLTRLICERLTDQTEEGYTSFEMQRGIDLEPAARDLYSFLTDTEVEQVAWIDHPTIPMAGCSVDGLCGTDGGIEIKCLGNANHYDFLINREVDPKYMKQMQFSMSVTSRLYWDHVLYNPNFPEHMQLIIKRVFRDEEMISAINKAVVLFESAVTQGVKDANSACQRNA